MNYVQIVSKVALQNSRLRKLDNLIAASNLDGIPDAPEEMRRDWFGAIGWLLEWVMTGSCPISSFDDLFLAQLGLAWFDDLKEYKSYCYWRANWCDGGVWTTASQECRNYYKALDEIHGWLLDRANKQHNSDFVGACNYLQQHYLDSGSLRNDGNAVVEIIRRKARRIWERTGNSRALDNWIVAERYVKEFYENIITAVQEQSQDCVLTVVRTMQKNSPLIDGFEATLAIRFLDPDIVRECENFLGKKNV